MVVAPDAKLAAELVTHEQQAAFDDVPGRGQADHRDRAAEHRPGQDRRLPGLVRDQPGERRADPGLGGRLRAGRLRHRRDHGGARPGPARLEFAEKFGLPIVRTVSPPASFEGKAYTGDATPAISSANAEIRLDGLTDNEAEVADHRLAGEQGGWASGRSTTGCATGC